MNDSIGKSFFSVVGSLLKAIWKLMLLALYGSAKIIETIAVFISRVTERMLN